MTAPPRAMPAFRATSLKSRKVKSAINSGYEISINPANVAFFAVMDSAMKSSASAKTMMLAVKSVRTFGDVMMAVASSRHTPLYQLKKKKMSEMTNVFTAIVV